MQSERHSREDWYRAVRHRNLVPKARLCHWRPFTPEASRRHVLNVYGVVVVEFFHFFLRECGFYRFKTNRRSTTTNTNIANKVKSRVKIKNQDRRRVASICLQVQAVDRLLLLPMYHWMIGKLEDLKRINIYFNSCLFSFYHIY